MAVKQNFFLVLHKSKILNAPTLRLRKPLSQKRS